MAQTIRTVVPHDSTNMTAGCRAIYVGGTGDITVVNSDNTTAVFKAVPVGTTLPISPKRSNATGTTATLMVAIF